MNVTGDIQLTANWAQLNLDPGQPVNGYVVLMKNPMAPGATQAERIAAAYNYFATKDGVHYRLSGQLTPSGGINYFLFTRAVAG
jgi:hypothetical protein